MYRVKKGKAGVVRLFHPSMSIDLETATQEQLKLLFDKEHPFVVFEKEKKEK